MLILAALFLLVSSEASEVSRIINGHDVSIEERPFQVALRVGGNLNCGGSIVAERFVLTAAHCVEWLPAGPRIITAGTAELNDTSVTAKPSDVFLHPLHDSINMEYDAALIKTDRAFIYGSKIQPIALASQVPSNGSLVTASGWGLLQLNGTVSPPVLKAVTLSFVDHETCAAELAEEDPRRLSESMLCTYTAGRSPCHGDSGGPLTDSSGQLLGVVSWGVECGTTGLPCMYTSVPAIRDWVQETIHNHTAATGEDKSA